MKLFLSWSGETSRRVGESLRRHFPLIIQELEPFLSAHDTESGARWTETLTNKLDESSFGILCLTPENLESKWLYFEAGALTKHSEGRACCLLLGGLQIPDVPPPLSVFQNRSFTKSEISALLRDINRRVEHPLAPDALDTLLSKFWPELESEYEKAIANVNRTGAEHRNDRALLEEILLSIRSFAALSNRSSVEIISQGSDILSRPTSYDSLAWYTLWKFPGMDISERLNQILLRDIDTARYPTIGDVDRVVNRARDAVDTYAAENPEWFKYGTDRITKSLGFVDEDFRARHGFADRTRLAFPRYQHLVRPDEEQSA
jgi:hypothetical protein